MKRAAVASSHCLLTAVPAAAQSVSIDLGSGGSASATRPVSANHGLDHGAVASAQSACDDDGIHSHCDCSIIAAECAQHEGTPPNTVLIGLALFLTFFVMQPVLQDSLGSRSAATQ